MTEILQVDAGRRQKVHRVIALSVIAIGAALSLTGIRPVSIILSAQFANGLLLPLIAVFLLYAMNQRRVLGNYVNGAIANTLGAGVVIIATALGLRLVLRTFGLL